MFHATVPVEGSGALTASCGDEPGIACRLTWDITHSTSAAQVWGAQELSSKEVTMRIVAKTAPMRQWEVARELRARVKAALDTAGVAPAGRTPS